MTSKYINDVYMNIVGQSFGAVWDPSSVLFHTSPGRVCALRPQYSRLVSTRPNKDYGAQGL